MSVTSAQSDRIQQTALHALHRELGARMVPFAGYELPVQFPGGIRHEHEITRKAAGLFDISHMGQIRIDGAGAARALEALVPSDISGLAPWRQRYTVLTNPAGGIIDDLMVTAVPGGLFLVVNGACKEGDLEYLEAKLGRDCRVEARTDLALLALQGPASAEIISRLVPAAAVLRFLEGGEFELDGVPCLIHRCGYTGEDGFEISVPAERAESLARRILSCPGVEPAGLGARDSLRLEAGLCLYGHDLDQSTTPVEADLHWVIARRYRESSDRNARFPGAGIILEQLKTGASRRRVGLRPEGRLPVRERTELTDGAGAVVGRVTSGGFGSTVGGPVAMGYVAPGSAEPDTELQVLIRNRSHNVRVVAMPFVPHRYRR